MGDKPDMKLRHVVWPSLFAIGLVFVSVIALDENKFPPMIIALIAAVLTAPTTFTTFRFTSFFFFVF